MDEANNTNDSIVEITSSTGGVDTYTEVTHQSWFGRIGNSIVGAIFGVIFFIGGMPLLFWNEGRAVQTARILDQGAGLVKSVSSETIDAANENKLIHITGKLTTNENLTDNAFGVTQNAIRLVREVEVYQWREVSKTETRDKIGGGKETITTYNYDKTWSSSPVDSSKFKQPAGHTNPKDFAYKSATYQVNQAKVGAYSMPKSLIDDMGNVEKLSLKEGLYKVSGATQPLLNDGALYFGKDPVTPQVGDMRVTFKWIAPQSVSVVAGQRGSALESFTVPAGGSIAFIQAGTVSAADMFKSEQATNTVFTWILRIVGWLLMFLGVMMSLGPISAFAKFIPFIGNIADWGIMFAGFAVASFFATIIVAVAWVFYRPLIAIGLVVLGVAIVVGIKMLRGGRIASPSRLRTRKA